MPVTRTEQAGSPSHDQLDTILQKFSDLEYIWVTYTIIKLLSPIYVKSSWDFRAKQLL